MSDIKSALHPLNPYMAPFFKNPERYVLEPDYVDLKECHKVGNKIVFSSLSPFNVFYHQYFTVEVTYFSVYHYIVHHKFKRYRPEEADDILKCDLGIDLIQKSASISLTAAQKKEWANLVPAFCKLGFIGRLIQRPDYLYALLTTKPYNLVYASRYDYIYSCGLSFDEFKKDLPYRGSNLNGITLQFLRDEFAWKSVPGINNLLKEYREYKKTSTEDPQSANC